MKIIPIFSVAADERIQRSSCRYRAYEMAVYDTFSYYSVHESITVLGLYETCIRTM